MFSEEIIFSIALCLFLTIGFAGLGAWAGIFAGYFKWNQILPVQTWIRTRVPLHAFILTASWLGLNLIGSFFSSEGTDGTFSMTTEGLLVSLGLSCLLFLGILATMVFSIANFGNRKSLQGYGFVTQNLPLQLRTAVWGVCLSLPAVLLFSLSSLPFREQDGPSNPLLQLLNDQTPVSMLVGIVVMAVIAAPLLEELMFRVVLQGWLEPRIGQLPAVISVAVFFCLAHGFPDAIGLLPLALILGFMYTRGHSYFAVVFTHAAFNAIMLFMAWAQTLVDFS